jgi:F-type H+-transporting ATPase subunit delta
MQNDNKKIKNYSNALLSIIRTSSNEVKFRNDLNTFCELIKTNSDLRSFLSSSTIYDEGKVKTLQELLSNNITESLLHFLLIMASQGDIMLVQEIKQQFLRELSESENIRFGEIHTPYKISSKKIGQLEKIMSDYLNTDVSLQLKIDKSISGGLKIVVDDIVFDDTIENRLSQMRKQIVL